MTVIVDSRRDFTLDNCRRIAWEGGSQESGAGVAEGIDERGNLTVVTGDGERHSLGAGEVRLMPPGRVERSG